MGKDRHGANGADIVLKVPVGTQIYEEDGETLLADLDKVGDARRAGEGRQRRLRQRAFQDARPTARRATPIPASRARSAPSGCA